MITLIQWQTIRHLAEIGKSQRDIAEILNLSRVTVARALKQDERIVYHREPIVLEQLEPHREETEARIGRGLAGKRLLKAVREAGYAGSSATFYRWLSTLRHNLKTNTSLRFETGPAQQAQFDWSPYVVVIGNECLKVIVYSLLVCYSRRIHWLASLSERQDSVLEGIEAGLRHFDGACRFLLIDNAKSMVLRHRHRQVVWNQCFLAFCGHYRIEPIAATPVHPQTKGKVENPFYHLEEDFIVGNSWRDWSHFCEDLAAYEVEREDRVHHTTRQTPAARFEEERASLIKLPPRPFLGCQHHIRRPNNDGLISFEGNRYCLPNTGRFDHVRVRTHQGRELIIYDPAGNQLIRHTIAPKGSPPVLLPECYEALRARRRLSLATQTALLRQRFADAAVVEEFLACLLKEHKNHPESVLEGVLQLLEPVADPVALRVLADAAELGLPEAATIAELLRSRLKAAPGQNAPAAPLNRPVPALDVERPLSVYASCLPPPDEEKLR